MGAVRRCLLRGWPLTPPRFFRQVAADRWVAQGTAYALEKLPSGTYQFFSRGKPAFTVASLLDAEQALTDVIEAGGTS